MNWQLLLKSFLKTVGICGIVIACIGALIGAMVLIDFIIRKFGYGASIALIAVVIIGIGTWGYYIEEKDALKQKAKQK